MASRLKRPLPVRSVGRPLQFDRGKVLSIALELFLRRGYVDTSLDVLTSAMGIARPSVYRAFGNKESLFLHALDLHLQKQLTHLKKALAEPSLRKAADRLLRGALSSRKIGAGVAGFLGLMASLPPSGEFLAMREEIAARQAIYMAVLTERFATAKASGELSTLAGPEEMAFLLESLTHSLVVRACGGASEDDLETLVETSLSIIVPEPGAPAFHL